MTYQEAIEYLYNATPQFQRIGAAAYKPGLDTVKKLGHAMGNPHLAFPVIHVAGTNGKGSTSHTIAAVLQEAGFKVGLYTSPHLFDFRERIRVDGCMIPRDRVAAFVERYIDINHTEHPLQPSFFELTTIMAFDWFKQQKVDVAVVEVGLGGRLDSTNIISPALSVITNISLDHTAQLGNTLEEIAVEKAGIMRRGVPVVIGEPNQSIRNFLINEANRKGAIAVLPTDILPDLQFAPSTTGGWDILNTYAGQIHYELAGDYQRENAATVLAAIATMRKLGWEITDEAIRNGFAAVCSLTGLMGRWMKIADHPLTICDTGHNIGGWQHLARQIQQLKRPLVLILGFVNDKDTSHIFPLLPHDVTIIYTNADIPRALPAAELAARGKSAGHNGIAIPSVSKAYSHAISLCPASIFIGGSTFVVADLLASLPETNRLHSALTASAHNSAS